MSIIRGAKLQQEIDRNEKSGRDKLRALCEQKGGIIYHDEFFLDDRLSDEDFAELGSARGKGDRPFDAIIEKNGKFYLVEIKDRGVEYESYNDYVLERQKYDHIQEWKKKLKPDGSYYCNFFENRCYMFLLEDDYITKKPGYRNSNKCTAASRDESHKVLKPMYFLPKNHPKVKKFVLNE